MYVRHAKPNTEKLEEKLAGLEHGKFAFAFNSGITAISAALMTVPPGGYIIMPCDMYGDMYPLVKRH
ncbi:PLP-dependent transferase [Salinicoccus sp. ID82-1]|uniref:PLP-dependent transferase n=1 Tax=Salinicoccus sp. ID82-1 TaxID=2820269 RepID=UPI001F02B711|nr:PLP-dependent transferase [Salinicoccus sp. ID82-1]MCG1010484.1 PLP-dependent transferase [Salinicoccus sp. ID82-1]